VFGGANRSPFFYCGLRELNHQLVMRNISLIDPRVLLKAGIMLSGISQLDNQQTDLFIEIDDEKSDRLMSTIDQINSRFGRGTLHVASTDLTSQ